MCRIYCKWNIVEYSELSTGDYIKMVLDESGDNNNIIIGIVDTEKNTIETIYGKTVLIVFYRIVRLYKFEQFYN